jgi:membrane fusion protein
LTGVVSRAQLLNQHDQALQSLAQVASLKAQEMDLKRQVQQIKESVERLPIETAIKRNQTQRQVDDVAQAQVENEARRSIMITAPCAGVVTNVLVNEGQALDARQSVVTVLQRHVVLQAELWMSTSAIGFVHEGQLVILRYRAFPYQKFGEYYGRVNEVSRSAVFPNEVSKITGRISDQSSYRVEVTLDSQDVDIYGKRERLKPGMELEADVLLERQRLIAWMFEPLFAVSGGTSLEKTTGRAQP